MTLALASRVWDLPLGAGAGKSVFQPFSSAVGLLLNQVFTENVCRGVGAESMAAEGRTGGSRWRWALPEVPRERPLPGRPGSACPRSHVSPHVLGETSEVFSST